MIYDLVRDLARQMRLQEAREVKAIRDTEMNSRLIRKQRLQNPTRYFFSEKERIKAEKEAHLKRRADEVDGLNELVSEALFRFENILRSAVTAHNISFDNLRSIGPPPNLFFDTALLQAAPRPIEGDYFDSIEEPAGLMSWLPAKRRKYEDDIQEAEERYNEALQYWEQSEAARLDSLRSIKSEYEKQLKAYEREKAQRSYEIDAFISRYEAGEYEAIVALHAAVLERSNYPEDFPREFSLAYTASSKMLVIEYRLPNPSVVPSVEEYRYVRAGDKIVEKARKASSIADLYADIVASIALRSLLETFSFDEASHIDVVCFNGYIHTIDPATGRDIQPHLLSVRTSKSEFLQIDLHRVDKQILTCTPETPSILS